MPVTAQQERITRTHGSTNLESGEFRASPPSEIVPGVQGGHVDTAPQQASTQPGDGSEVRVSRASDDRSKGLSGTFNGNIPFKERVVGGAQKIRGTVLGKPDLKEHGQAILDGRTTHEADKQKRD
ncbi:hypothetical protein CC1G_03002 [Coprinopsis cinerea okayama7|uniref:Uncharacterized protein n=1 Tax=Coprinopsis cinerea (strain Okayama-7 / 130 / ATCC MYA-4618 / FGSC 9003) TaxID=240176 RepID=A8NS19_COPC7|nr:hypothetical protein CC1G_03002 [Coprinopsis cinerea okayama7\|eukprot:XP_001835914.2 hypothetical protein CC1G_03002 [Coprinopsis cinerea okayama7\